MKTLTIDKLKGLSTTDLFSVSTILQDPRIETKKRFLEMFDGAKVTPDNYKKIKELIDEPKLDVYSKNEVVSIDSYYSTGDHLVNVKSSNILAKVLDFHNGRVHIQIQSIGVSTPYTPAIYSRVMCPISAMNKSNLNLY